MSDKKYIASEADKIIDKLCFFANYRFLDEDNIYIKVYNYEEDNRIGHRLYINGIELEYYKPLNEDIIRCVYKKLCDHFGGEFDEETHSIKINNVSLFREKVKKKILK